MPPLPVRESLVADYFLKPEIEPYLPIPARERIKRVRLQFGRPAKVVRQFDDLDRRIVWQVDAALLTPDRAPEEEYRLRAWISLGVLARPYPMNLPERVRADLAWTRRWI